MQTCIDTVRFYDIKIQLVALINERLKIFCQGKKTILEEKMESQWC